MKKDRKYVLYLVAAFLLYAGIKLFSPAKIDWTVSYHKEDRNPFGAYALYQSLPSLFPAQKINDSYHTLYELLDTIKSSVNFISISTRFNPGKEDVEALLKTIEAGGHAFIAAQYFNGGTFSDTLNLNTENYFFNRSGQGYINQDDTSSVRFVNDDLPREHFNFPRKNTNMYFSSFDSTRTSILAKNDFELPVLIRIQWGKGNLILCSIPLAFTNIYLLRDNHHEFAEAALSFLPVRPVHWTEFYHSGRMESRSFLRFVLQTESLRWAYAISILSLVLYMIFEAKRKQRIIPVIKPLTNTTLEFVQTVGNLYYQNSDHKNIAEKKISFLMDYIRSTYWLRTNVLDEAFSYALAKKSGNSHDEIKALFSSIKNIQNKPAITADELMDLNRRMEWFRRSPKN